MTDIAKQENHIGVPPEGRYPRFDQMRPIVFTVEHGDATYIPPGWWHAVESAPKDQSFGVTLARCWRSTLDIHFNPNLSGIGFFRKHGTLPMRAYIAMTSTIWQGLRAIGAASDLDVFR